MKNKSDFPFLDSIKSKENNLQVPENYFEDLPSEINKIIASKKTTTFFFQKLFWIPAISISVIILLILLLKPETENNTEIYLSNTQQLALLWDQSYAEDVYYAQMDELETLISNSDQRELITSDALVNLSNDEIVNYLQEESSDEHLEELLASD